MGRRRVEIVIHLLNVLAVVPLMSSDAEHPLLEYAILAIPETQREAKSLMVVRYTRDAVLAPAVHARACVLVREVTPGIAVRGVVLAHRRLCARHASVPRIVSVPRVADAANTTHPLPVAKVRTPPLPVAFLPALLIQTEALRAVVLLPELVGDPLAERPGVGVLFALLWRRLLLWHLGRARAILHCLRRGEDGVGYVDREAALSLRGVGGLRGFVVAVQIIVVLTAKNLCLEFLEVGALLRHGGQRGDDGRRERVLVASC